MRLEVRYTNNIGERLHGLAAEFRAVREQLLDQASNQLEQALDRSITASGLRDIHGKVRSWQETKKGSGGGYVAIHPKPRTFVVTQTGKEYAVGYITNAIENGHKVRFPSGRAKRYRPEVHMARARAFKFYADTQPVAEEVAREMAQSMERRLAAYLEG